jgi:peptidoglycan/LPS O-acetylase OafA/YrhL
MSTLQRNTEDEATEQSPDVRAAPPLVPASAERGRGGGRGFSSVLRGGGRVAGLDGLRTVAVVLVIVYHVEPDLVPGGSVGVDVFFTISGFVITRLLVGEYARTGGIGLWSFYRRRWVRLMPALLVMCAVTAAAVRGVRAAAVPRGVGGRRAGAGSVVNLVRAGDAGAYSDLTAPLSHTWSLGVEEQFYLAWPLLLLVLLRHARARSGVGLGRGAVRPAGALADGALGPLGRAPHLQRPRHPRRPTPHRGAARPRPGPAARRRPRLESLRRWAGRLCLPALTLLGLIAWQIPITEVSGWNPAWYTVGFLVAALLTACVVATLDLCPRAWPTRLLSLSVPVWIGRNLSYGMYLWHYPVIRLLHDLGVQGDTLLQTGLAATLAAALASYALVERPLLRRGRPRVRRPEPVVATEPRSPVL